VKLGERLRMEGGFEEGGELEDVENNISKI
jgi:hypothetical protein